MTNWDDLTTVSYRIPAWAKQYVDLAAARLGIAKQDVVAEALRFHRDYLSRSGVFSTTSLEEQQNPGAREREDEQVYRDERERFG